MLAGRDEAMDAGTLVEYRLDWLELGQTRKLLTDHTVFKYPAIMTARRKDEGGRWDGTEQARLDTLHYAMDQGAPYLDIELDAYPLADFFSTRDPEHTSLIVSVHNTIRTPLHLEGLYNLIRRTEPDIVKIATWALSYDDSLRMLQLVARVCDSQPTIGLCMGERGKITRVLSQVYGGWGTFAACGQVAAPGQLAVAETIRLVKEARGRYENSEFLDPDEITAADLEGYARALGL